jgi:hypothetical protein
VLRCFRSTFRIPAPLHMLLLGATRRVAEGPSVLRRNGAASGVLTKGRVDE